MLSYLVMAISGLSNEDAARRLSMIVIRPINFAGFEQLDLSIMPGGHHLLRPSKAQGRGA